MQLSLPGLRMTVAAVLLQVALAPFCSAAVTAYDVERSWDGLNLRVADDSPGAVLMDMDGSVVHEWSCTFSDAFPGVPVPAGGGRATRWTNARLLPGGELLGVFGTYGLVKLDRDSNVVWAHAGGEHHDLDVAPDGRIFALGSAEHLIRWISHSGPVEEDYVLIIDAYGNELRRFSLLDAIMNSEYSNLLKTAGMGRSGSVLGANSIELLDGALSDVIPAFRGGNLLVSFKRLSSIAVVDVESEKVVWSQFGMWLEQCDATQVPGGDILVMDGRSDLTRVVEYDPVTMEVAWEYSTDATPPDDEAWGGSCQRLPNGNTIVAESGRGRALEVAPDRDVVWSYELSAGGGAEGSGRGQHFELRRLSRDAPWGLLPGR